MHKLLISGAAIGECGKIVHNEVWRRCYAESRFDVDARAGGRQAAPRQRR
jgi:hypothetical protein